ncbi:prepilin peptidase [Anaeromyxobacter sp. Red801]|uniref:prepilin peptidase n=1 Tax=Anaeromyxobacter sp. Red801 TaxID=3411632 RepID=UPI003BA0D4F1
MSTLPPDPLLRAAVLAWVFAVGAVIGSFLNVVIARVPVGESIVHPPSRCPACGAGIRWFDNIPIVSWLLLRARCRRCAAPISWRYPAVELLGALAALIAFQRHGLTFAAAAELAFVAALVALAFIDLDTWLLPHAITWPVLGTGLAASALGVAAAPSLRSSALGAALGFAAFALVSIVGERVLRKEALGFGDVWLLAGLGAWLGAGALIPVVLFASTQGALVGLAQIAAGKGQPGPAAEEPEASDPPGTPPDAPAAPVRDGPAASPPSEEVASQGPASEHDGAREDDDWVPPRHAVPFGPFLVLGALEWLYGAHALASLVPGLRPFL